MNVHEKTVVIAEVTNKDVETNMRNRRQNMDSAVNVVGEYRMRTCK
jgi:hypothetical protein